MMMFNILDAKPSVVAGSFYPKDTKRLTTEVKDYLKNTDRFSAQNIDAIIVPHAGYVFSASTAAQAYASLHQTYKNVFLIGSSHHQNFQTASIYTQGNYKTPLGEVQVNQEIVSALMQNQLFTYNKKAHEKEHTLEVQLPFLQTLYGDELQIIPIIIGTSKLENIIALAKLLHPYFMDKDNLFVISSDLSHYPSYADANVIDKLTLDAISKNSSKEFIEAIVKNENSYVDGLVTSACGWSSLLTLLYMTQDEEYEYELLEYKNSGDTKYGDKDKVVGYGALRVYKKSTDFFLSQDEKKELLDLARLSLYELTLHNKKIIIDEKTISPKLRRHLGAFVTLNKKSKLRGCIGRFEPNQALYELVIDMAIAAAQNDPRFSKVEVAELEDIELEISVLSPRWEIHSLDEINLGEHGIYVESGLKHGTYLPHVATQMQWNKKEFVESCAFDKAQLNQDEYKNARFFIYNAIVFDDKK